MNMLIYQCTHKPTGKYYIGSKKDGEKFLSGEYLTSSPTVKAMMKANPEEWIREVHDEFPEEWGWTFQEVVALEHVLIKEAVERDGWDGVWNQVYRLNQHMMYSPEAQAKAVKIAKSLAGKNHPSYGKPLSDETKAKIGAAHRGKIISDGTRAKMSASGKGRLKSEEHKAKIGAANTGKVRSAEIKAKLSADRTGEKHHSYGTTHSDETKAKMKAKALARAKKTCEHCGKSVDPGIFARYHGDRCKHNPNNKD